MSERRFPILRSTRLLLTLLYELLLSERRFPILRSTRLLLTYDSVTNTPVKYILARVLRGDKIHFRRYIFILIMSTKVAAVTGSNKGIGFAIVRGLCKRFPGVVYLTSRDENRGKDAVALLEKEGLSPMYHQLDITNTKSIEDFRDHIKKTYGGLDLLINNAATAFNHDAPEPVAVQAEQTLFVNYFSVLSTCEVLFPILRNGARVVNISSSYGHLSHIPSKKLRQRFLDPTLTIEELSEMMSQYVEAAKKGTHVDEWGNSSYVVSKVGLTALTKIQQRLLADKDIKVNAVHPGYVDTDLTSHKGPLTIDQGAVAPLFLALDAPDSVQGQYVWPNKDIVNWDGKIPPE